MRLQYTLLYIYSTIIYRLWCSMYLMIYCNVYYRRELRLGNLRQHQRRSRRFLHWRPPPCFGVEPDLGHHRKDGRHQEEGWVWGRRRGCDLLLFHRILALKVDILLLKKIIGIPLNRLFDNNNLLLNWLRTDFYFPLPPPTTENTRSDTKMLLII